ncbi:TonB-linked SusC/RagA family outer membrane protein [Anseongella ginsenosidimutans]|uniref:TonB-linked SusC/RagA family outer membrane protein n=1 Tax=Anseongella ginsenosidimutans TaxID=496056 RepID=A0A4R3KNQ2_9SPHI|nr:SusC/RagA family TonB-linked outer membrane protein [Anseongella ginsenosidimutans]QEC52395.1 SusC/RagA family TonB-linked outer membrane protein [Anseongella ginsenosidimutans]TCS85863.1 TonB-linked SusC/RagA family outer membrane protein [Anseongella ginsenosidimutans]
MRKRFIWMWMLGCLLAAARLNAQDAGDFQVSGTVTSAQSGETLPGVSVVYKGTGIGTSTDTEGKYAFRIPDGEGVLVITYVGFETLEVPVNERSEIDIVLEPDVAALDEVVVIGYGEQSRATLTNAVSKIDVEELENTPSINPVQALQGKAAGLDIRVTTGMPGSGADVIIRGGTSLSSDPDDNAPLVIIDGVYRTLADVNPADIESIQVLKDAASTAIYGAQGANGIILITTKSGGANEKGQITVDYSHQVEQMSNQYPWSSARDYIWASRIAANAELDHNTKNRLTGGAYPYSTGAINGSLHGEGYGNSVSTVEFTDDLRAAEGDDYVNNLINNRGYETMTDPVTGRELIFKDNNYQDVMFRTAATNDLNVGFQKGGKQYSIYTSLGFADANGMMLGTYYKRLSYVINGEFWPRENIKVSAGLNYQYADYAGPQDYSNTMRRSSKLPHTTRLYYDDGTPAIGESAGSPRNILHELYYEDFGTKRNRTTMRLGMDWELIDGLSFKPSASVYQVNSQSTGFERYHEYNTRREMYADHELSTQYMVDGILTYDKNYGDHSLGLLAGTNYTFDRRFLLQGDGENAPTDHIPTLNASATEFERVTSEQLEDALLSYFGRVNYDFRKKYLFSASLRYDGSSRFAEDKKWGLFPAFSLGWNVHREDFWNWELMNRLKVRGSWGQAGNNNLSISDTQGEYAIGYNYAGQSGLLNTVLANRGLLWETTTSFDVGLDIGLFNDRVTLLADYYNKITDDRLVSIPLASQTGFSSIVANYGKIRNRGLELELGAAILQNSAFKWNTSLTFSFNRLIVMELPENGNEKNRVNGGLIYDKALGDYIMVGGLAEGERIGGVWAYNMLGVYATDEDAANAPYDTKVAGAWLNVPDGEQQKVGGDAIWEDLDGNGIIDDRDVIFMGYTSPDKFGGMVNSFSWKGFSARLVVDYALGHVINNSWRARANGNARNRVMTLTDVTSGEMWWNQGDQAKYPRYNAASDWDNGKRNHVRQIDSYDGVGVDVGYNTDNSLYFSKGDFLAFREVSFSYRLPSELVAKRGINGITLTAGAYNLGYLTAFDGLSPEQYNGIEEGGYPRPLQFRFGIDVNF